MQRAISSLPVPLSPVISTGASRSATRRIRSENHLLSLQPVALPGQPPPAAAASGPNEPRRIESRPVPWPAKGRMSEAKIPPPAFGKDTPWPHVAPILLKRKMGRRLHMSRSAQNRNKPGREQSCSTQRVLWITAVVSTQPPSSLLFLLAVFGPNSSLDTQSMKNFSPQVEIEPFPHLHRSGAGRNRSTGARSRLAMAPGIG